MDRLGPGRSGPGCAGDSGYRGDDQTATLRVQSSSEALRRGEEPGVWEQSSFVGRDAEKAALRRALQERGCQAAFVVGPAGVGKTRLLREAAGAATEAGWAVKWVTASPTSAAIPYAALAQALPTLEGADGLQVLRTATRLIDEAAARSPVAVFIDDAPHLDEASAAVAVHVALLDRAFVVASSRSGSTGAAVPGPAWRDVPARCIELAPLNIVETRQLVDSILEGSVGEATVGRLHRLSQGNPLFITELVRGGLLGGQLWQDGTYWQWSGGFEFTPRLRDMIGGHLDGAPTPVRAVVDCLAYAGTLSSAVLQDLGAEVTSTLR